MKATREGDRGDAVAGGPDRALGMTDAQLDQIVVGGRAGHLPEGPRERAERVPGVVRHVFDTQVRGAMVAQVREHVTEPAPRREVIAVDRNTVTPERHGKLDEQ